MTEIESGTLEIGEVHPSAHDAFQYVKECIRNPFMIGFSIESLASCSLSGNRLAEVCLATLDRIKTGQPVSDRYILGLAWMLKTLNEGSPKENETN